MASARRAANSAASSTGTSAGLRALGHVEELARQILEPWIARAGAEKIGREERAERPFPRAAAQRAQGELRLLRVVTADRGALGELARDCVHRVLTRHIKGVTRRGHADAASPRSAAGALREGEDPDVSRAAHEARRLGRVVDDPQSIGPRRRLKGQGWLHGHLVWRREPAQELAELEAVENCPHLVVVVASPARALEVELDRDVADDRDHPLAEPNLVGVLLEVVLEPALGQLIDPLQNGLHRAVVLDQLGGGLVADPRHAGDVV